MSHDLAHLIVVDAAEEAFLDLLTGVNYTLHLFSNEVTSGLSQAQIEALDETDLTEATFAGYASAALTGGSWTVTQADPSVASYAEQTFTRSSSGTPENIWGYYVTRTSDGALMWFEEFAAPVVIEFAADALAVTPRITLDDTEGNTVQTGIVSPYAGSTAPSGWLLCDGSAVSRATYSDLFAVIGETYGAGDGATTFNLPDVQQKFPLGKATSGTGATLGEEGGAIDHVHDLDTSTSHAKFDAIIGSGASDPQWRARTVTSWNPTKSGDANWGSAIGVAHTEGIALGGDSDSANPPYVTFNFIIKV